MNLCPYCCLFLLWVAYWSTLYQLILSVSVECSSSVVRMTAGSWLYQVDEAVILLALLLLCPVVGVFVSSLCLPLTWRIIDISFSNLELNLLCSQLGFGPPVAIFQAALCPAHSNWSFILNNKRCGRRTGLFWLRYIVILCHLLNEHAQWTLAAAWMWIETCCIPRFGHSVRVVFLPHAIRMGAV